MKKILLLVLSLSAGHLYAQSPIVIDRNDMPNTGDTLRISRAVPSLLIDTVYLDLQSTGPNHTWDFSFLQPISQQVESFVPVSSTGFTYQLVFNNSFFSPLTYSSIASPAQLPAQLAGMGVSNPIGFYRETNTQFYQTGWGGNLNGTDVPVGFSAVDVIYSFPLTYQSQHTSNSAYDVSVPSMGYLAHEQVRSNIVDGWGTIITPFGTFQALRVVSTIAATDTFNTNGQGMMIEQPLTREYKWLAKNSATVPLGIPVLQITTQQMQGIEMPTQIQYRDHYRNLNPNAAPNDVTALGFTVSPNPFSDKLTVKLPGNNKLITLTLFDNMGRQVLQESTKNTDYTLQTSKLNASQGFYFLQISDGETNLTEKLVHIR